MLRRSANHNKALPGYNHSRLPPGDAPQFADHSPAQLKNWLLNTLDEVSQQARGMLGMNPAPTATPTRLSVAGQDKASGIDFWLCLLALV